MADNDDRRDPTADKHTEEKTPVPRRRKADELKIAAYDFVLVAFKLAAKAMWQALNARGGGNGS